MTKKKIIGLCIGAVVLAVAAAGVKEGLATAKECRKVPYSRERLKNYLAIEWELITGTLIYVYEFAARQIAKL